MLVVGDREMEEGIVAVRERKSGDLGTMTLEEFTQKARGLVASRAINNQ